MRPILKSIRVDSNGASVEFKPWGNAKPDLVIEIGSFCSYCEKYNSRSSLHVEHILAKGCLDTSGNLIYDHLKYRWDNFLLACTNCNSVKDNKDVAILKPFLPHENNLIYFIEILNGGLINIKAGVTGIDLKRTESFIDLVGLDRVPGHKDYSDKDDRWDNRLKVFDIAKRQFEKYTETPPSTDLENIIELAKTNGYFSIWYYQFIKYPAVINALINGLFVKGNQIVPFPGIHIASFDIKNHYQPLLRP